MTISIKGLNNVIFQDTFNTVYSSQHHQYNDLIGIYPLCRERERMKQLTLEISERQEQEELSEALQQLQRVTQGELKILRLVFLNKRMSCLCGSMSVFIVVSFIC